MRLSDKAIKPSSVVCGIRLTHFHLVSCLRSSVRMSACNHLVLGKTDILPRKQINLRISQLIARQALCLMDSFIHQ